MPRDKAGMAPAALLSPDVAAALAALAVGFAFAGLVASAFEWATDRRAGLWLLRSGDLRAVASVPIVVLAGPVLVMRGVLGSRTNRPAGFGPAFAAAIVAALWSLASGRLVLDLALVASGTG